MQSDHLDSQLDSICERWNLLKHPFYVAWAAGTLSRAQLRDYAAQYAHVVAAIPQWIAADGAAHPARAAELRAHAAEEAEHVGMWAEFAAALADGQVPAHDVAPNAATVALLRTGAEAAHNGSGTAAAWAIEAQSPAVSAEKLRGLAEHYDIREHNGARYFALHAELDKDHEQQLRSILHEQAVAASQASLRAAEATASGLWDLLSSVYEKKELAHA
ncbi:MAG: iron-containing redox enzyme family protein [Candidatus Eremiobacteraeota bacterium]|nr:iron-containing redox enzyme family protein [Candidatus Eremiobacteraeota bacterium]